MRRTLCQGFAVLTSAAAMMACGFGSATAAPTAELNSSQHATTVDRSHQDCCVGGGGVGAGIGAIVGIGGIVGVGAGVDVVGGVGGVTTGVGVGINVLIGLIIWPCEDPDVAPEPEPEPIVTESR